MKINQKFLKVSFYLLTLGGLLYYLYVVDLLKWIIAGFSILYLTFYFGIATIAVFAVSLSEIGTIMKGLSQSSPLLAIILLVPTILLLWFVLLLFWPLFIIPDSSLVRNPEKYDAIYRFETAYFLKYSKKT